MSETKTPARGRPRDLKSQEAILDAAFNVLQREGYTAATIERIAAEAGVAKQTIYRWWKGKAPLFMEVLAHKARQATELPDTGTFERDLASLLTATFEAVSTVLKPLMRALAAELLQDETFAQEMREVFVERRRANVTILVERAVVRGDLPVEADGDLVSDIVFGTMWYRLMFDHAPLDKEAAESLARAAAHAVRPNP
ncbi:MAG: TetR/AcrR family transcriptional regulator [Pseudomonadota bacterium]